MLINLHVLQIYNVQTLNKSTLFTINHIDFHRQIMVSKDMVLGTSLGAYLFVIFVLPRALVGQKF